MEAEFIDESGCLPSAVGKLVRISSARVTHYREQRLLQRKYECRDFRPIEPLQNTRARGFFEKLPGRLPGRARNVLIGFECRCDQLKQGMRLPSQLCVGDAAWTFRWVAQQLSGPCFD